MHSGGGLPTNYLGNGLVILGKSKEHLRWKRVSIGCAYYNKAT